jgi:hypothetical protein
MPSDLTYATTPPALEILFLVAFPVCAIIIDADPVCAAIPESAELVLLVAFSVCATIIDIAGRRIRTRCDVVTIGRFPWRWRGGTRGGDAVELEVVTR